MYPYKLIEPNLRAAKMYSFKLDSKQNRNRAHIKAF